MLGRLVYAYLLLLQAKKGCGRVSHRIVANGMSAGVSLIILQAQSHNNVPPLPFLLAAAVLVFRIRFLLVSRGYNLNHVMALPEPTP
jgi:hypothetical protein